MMKIWMKVTKGMMNDERLSWIVYFKNIEIPWLYKQFKSLIRDYWVVGLRITNFSFST